MGLPDMFPSVLQAAIQYYIADKMLDAQKDMRERLAKLAFENLELAEELFASHMELRAWDQRVYDFVKNLPIKERCQTQEDRGRITGHFVPAELLQNTFGNSRFNCGERSASIQNALSAGLITSGEGAAQAGNYEDLLVEGSQELRWTSITTSGAFQEFNSSSAFRSVGETMQGMSDMYGQAASGSLSAAGYSTAEAFDKFRKSQSGMGSIQMGAYGAGAGQTQGITGF